MDSPVNTLRICSNCKRRIDAREMICPFCGHIESVGATTRMIEKDDLDESGDARWGTARFNQKMKLVLNLKPTGGFTFAFDQIETLVLGRRDPITGEKPAIDLQDHNGEKDGVSRRHAMIKRMNANALTVIDNGSLNGTFLNGQRLIPHQPRILRDGDELRVGRLTLDVAFTAID